jgi:hypothetical protein
VRLLFSVTTLHTVNKFTYDGTNGKQEHRDLIANLKKANVSAER